MSRRAERVSRPETRQVATTQGLVGDECFTEPDTADPAGEVVGDDVEGEPGGVGAETTRRKVVESDAVFQVADGVFDLGVAAMVGLELERRRRHGR